MSRSTRRRLPTRCPLSGCGVDVRRPKCLWELDPGSCPRHALKHQLDALERTTRKERAYRCPHERPVRLVRTKPQDLPYRFRLDGCSACMILPQTKLADAWKAAA